MPVKKKKEEAVLPDFSKEKHYSKTVSETLKSNFMPYAMSVIVSRAIPEIDGLKPSHRKILYTMYEMGLLTGERTKSANIAARTMLYNPHGSASNYEAMVRLTQNNESLLTPYVNGKGNFGKHYSRDMAFAADRYTEAKLMPVASEFFREIRKNTVDFVDNYDSTRQEPVLLPVTFPTILANPTEGIAVGLASSIPSFNLNELCDATIQRIRKPEQSVRNVMPAPDFTTGGELLLNDAEMDEIYRTGRGSVKLRARYRVNTKQRIIEVYEIPYTTTAEGIIEQVIAGIKAGKISEVSDIRNEIDLTGFKIAIDYKRGVDPDQLMAKLFRLTKLQDAYNFNMTVLIDGTPKVLGVEALLDQWIAWRKQCVKRGLLFDIHKKEKELHLLEGLAAVLLDIDKAIRIIRASEYDDDVIPGLMMAFRIDEGQANFVAEIKLRNLNKRYILERTKAIEQLREEIGTLKFQADSKKEISRLIIKTLQEVKKKYGQARKTILVPSEEDMLSDTESSLAVPKYNVAVYITKEGYLKKIPETSLRTNPEIKVKDRDAIAAEFHTDNQAEILTLTDHYNAYKIYLEDVPDCKPSELGEFLNNLNALEIGENNSFTCLMEEKNLLIGFANGKVARIPLSSYATRQKRKKLLKAYSDRSPVLGIYLEEEETEFYVMAERGKEKRAVIFKASDVPLKPTKTTQGVQAMRLNKGFTISGFGKVTDYKFSKKAEAACRQHGFGTSGAVV